MNWYKTAQIDPKNDNKEVWVDSTGKVVYVKGAKYDEPRLTWLEFREFMESNTGYIEKTLADGSKVKYSAPFRKYQPE